VIAGLSAAIIGGFWLFLKYGKYASGSAATTQDRVMAQAMGIPVPWCTPRRLRSAPDGGGERRAVRSAGRCHHTMGLDWVLKAFIVVVVGAWAISAARSRRRSSSACWILRVDLDEPGEAVMSVVHRAHLTLLFRPTGLFRSDPQ